MRLALTQLALACALGSAQATAAPADSPFAVLTTPKASWTYDVVRGHPKHAPAALIRATLEITSVHRVGPYTVIETATTMAPPSEDLDVVPSTYMLGPAGLREVLYFNPADDGGYSEAHVASAYRDHYVPRAYLPARPAAKRHLRWKLDRFGDEDRTYSVHGSVAKLGAHGWRTAWKGSYEVPESGETVRYAWSTDFDPAIGFTRICTERDYCLRLVPAKTR